MNMKKQTVLTIVMFVVVAVLAFTPLSYWASARLQTAEPAPAWQGRPDERDGQSLAASANGGLILLSLKGDRVKPRSERAGGLILEEASRI
jgi:apolipoprotein N-acyltransferase